MTIGEKIKSLRKERGMTQAELSDGIVTRNMLSLIENGSARPSLSTARAFAERLGVPAEYLISDSDTATAFCKLDTIKSLKNMLAAGEYDGCLAKAEALAENDDEISLIIIICAMHLGEKRFNRREIAEARDLFARALENSEKTIYISKEEKAKIKRYYAMCDSIISRKSFTDAPHFSYGECDEACAYLAALSGVDVATELLPAHRSHVAAVKLMRSGRYGEAARAIFDQLRIAGDKLTKYCLLQSLEECFRKSGDFKGAIESAEKKREAYSALTKS